ncbi:MULTISPECIES: hypothetical protein [Klebsiella]|jgi:hypothetical protein|uniref:hypothetical protein n=1 Tax=Klebsiella TaxID=570 RepID=UPI0007CC8A64|nr:MULTISPECIES: hypothetical protein [Klebsiella]EKV5143532.1 hypothetical protein [Klebsiella michiganensis]EKV5145718.1 hypothetical protein [Klebsiella michiganensis]MDK3051610.1 hypothetical protein [Klebsiella michiganensis]MDU2425633.1 hypothetical protein [Klebsiella michiganensis]MDU7166485.1 hypothetical protein [Klebsiella sp.]
MTGNEEKEQLITARYGEKARPQDIIWNTQIEGLLKHRSVRHFSQQPLPELLKPSAVERGSCYRP